MTPLQWVLLCLLFTLYLLFGGSVFMYFEQFREIQKKEEISVLRKDIKEILIQLDLSFYNHNETTAEMINALTTAKLGVIHRIQTVCDVGELTPDMGDSPQTPTQDDPEDDKLKWTFYNSVFFAFTVVTTIGYGHYSPATNWSKIFIFGYALIGIPINTILLSGLGEYFSSRLTKVHKKSKENPEGKAAFILQLLFYLIPGIVVFIVFPAGIFVFIEGWTFLDSFYFAFVSLTTIGFGDLVAGMNNGHSVWMWIYKSFIIIWITFGLGYLIMILGFISKALTHKKVRFVIEKRLNTIRSTKEKLSRDIDYMRRVVNELYLMKIKPVYGEDDEEGGTEEKKAKRTHSSPCVSFHRRSSSFPNLGEVEAAAISATELAVGILVPAPASQTKQAPLIRRSSDTDLSHIDRDKTFEAALKDRVGMDELLSSVVAALSGNVLSEVMEAVEELNQYEKEVKAEGGMEEVDHPSRAPTQPHRHPHYDANEHLPPWDLGALSESDEEVLIDDLEVVVVHDEGLKHSASTSILEKVSETIRKISTGSRTASEGGPSRKVSRKISRSESFERRQALIRTYGPKPYLSPLTHPPQSPHSSEGHKISDASGPSRKASPGPPPTPSSRTSKISMESTSLAEFLLALDHVHAKLSSPSQSTTTTSYSDDFPRHTPLRRSGRMAGAAAFDLVGGGDPRRRRKNGIIHPQFSYVNNSYVFSDEEKDGEV